MIRGLEARELNRAYEGMQKATAWEPDLTIKESQPVSWWQLLRAGYSSETPLDTFLDPDVNLQGKPWRVLRKGSVRIPVWKKPTKDRELFPQHTVRMAAYAHLLKKSEQGDVPFGVILFHGSYDGLLIPVTEKAKAEVLAALEVARQTLLLAAMNEPIPGPPSKEFCKGCPHGKPIKHRLGESEFQVNGKTLSVCGALDGDGKIHHSLCGDRFRWLPPHQDAKDRLKL